MPLTLPTHPVAVIPLKLWRPHRFDGVALVLGAIAPDVAYAADGYGPAIHSHAWHAPLWWAVPLVLIGVRPVRWAAPTVAAHLPAGGRLALRDWARLAASRHRWWVTASSAALGAASHIVWDAFTHPRVDGGVVLFPVLHREPWPGVPWWSVAVQVSDAVGFVVAAMLVVHIGRSRLLVRWHDPVDLPPARPVRFWTVACAVTAGGLSLLPLQPVRLYHDQAVRAMLVVGAALLAAALAVRGERRLSGGGPSTGAGRHGHDDPHESHDRDHRCQRGDRPGRRRTVRRPG